MDLNVESMLSPPPSCLSIDSSKLVVSNSSSLNVCVQTTHVKEMYITVLKNLQVKKMPTQTVYYCKTTTNYCTTIPITTTNE